MRLFIFGVVVLLAFGTRAQDHGGAGRFPSSPLLPIAPVAYNTQSRIATGPSTLRQSVFARPVSSVSRGPTDPCARSPCGPNTRCESLGTVARCHCIDGYVPDDNTIEGCRPQCTSDSDCPDTRLCRREKCVRVCEAGACGLNAECKAVNHQARCSCPAGYGGDANTRCTRKAPPAVREPPPLPINNCIPNPCGTNADCRDNGQQPVCSCPRGYFGDPLSFCQRGECVTNADCPQTRSCQKLNCIDPCTGQCGEAAVCTVEDHNPVCSCPRGYTGDPFIRCRRFRPEDYCNPSPCGTGAICKPGNDRAICACPENHVGNPLTSCRPECTRDVECRDDQACYNNRCRDPCVDSCGEGAFCLTKNHRAACTCPKHYIGDPYTSCRAECTKHEDCSSSEACIDLKCRSPCQADTCGRGADCKVTKHQPICSCPKGYTGHPFESCRPFTEADLCASDPCGSNALCSPGFDKDGNNRPVCVCKEGFIGDPLYACTQGQCTRHSDCARTESCYHFQCQDACFVNDVSVCGRDAICTARDHTPVCSCGRGYEGDPLKACYPRAGAGSSAGGHSGFSRHRY